MIKTLTRSIRLEKEKFHIPHSVQDAIPIRRIWPDGVFQTGNAYSRSYRLTDINYAIASKADKTAMLLDYSELLNALDSGASAKITINNRRVDRRQFEQELLIRPQADTCLLYTSLVTAETEQEGMLFALTENTLYTGRAQNVPGMELQGIPVERIALEEPKAYQEHAVFFHRARGLDDITGRDVHRPVPERQTSFRVELAVVLSDAQFRQFKECGLMEDKLFLFENSSRMWFDPGELCWRCV